MANDTAPVDLDQETVEHDDRARRRAAWLIGAASVLALLLRLPFLFTGLSTDEGGYAYVAQQWSRGARLYGTGLTGAGAHGSAWLDRPQGLLLTYRALLWINDSGWTIRLGMMFAGALITAFLGIIGWQLAGQRAGQAAGQLAGPRVGVAAAFIYAIVGVAPHLEGMTLNGELLASVPATGAVAAALLWRRSLDRGSGDRGSGDRGSGDRGSGSARWLQTVWLAAAGLLAGTAMTMKQSGIDGVLAGLAIVLATDGPRIRRALGFLGGVAVPIAACVIHGAHLGLSGYWNALAGYQFSALGGAASDTGTRWSDFTHYLGSIALDLTIIVIVACFGIRALSRFGRIVAITWLAAGFVGVNLGGSYWPHYYMQPLPPLALLAAVAVTSFKIARVRVVAIHTIAPHTIAPHRIVAALLVLPTIVWMVALIPMSPHHRQKTIPYYALAVRDRHIADAIDAATSPDQRIYVLESEAYLYFLAQRLTSYPYLWGKPIQKIPAAVPLLRTMLEAPDRPVLVVLDTPDPAAVDPGGGIGRDLATYYHPDGVVDGVQILRAN